MKFRNIIVSLKCRNQEKNWEIPIKIVSLVKMVLRFKESTSKKFEYRSRNLSLQKRFLTSKTI